MKSLASTFFAACALCLVTACASNGGVSSADGTPVGGTGIQMFGVIDASVSHTTSKSTPVAPR